MAFFDQDDRHAEGGGGRRRGGKAARAAADHADVRLDILPGRVVGLWCHRRADKSRCCHNYSRYLSRPAMWLRIAFDGLGRGPV